MKGTAGTYGGGWDCDAPSQPYVALLLVEHEAIVRAYLTLLSPAEVPRDATPLLMDHEEPLQLVMGTVTMPFVSGRELAAVLESVQPRVPVLIVSGREWYRALRKGRLGGADPWSRSHSTLSWFGPESAPSARTRRQRS